MCHPLFVLAYLVSKNGIKVAKGEKGWLEIRDTNYTFSPTWYGEYQRFDEDNNPLRGWYYKYNDFQLDFPKKNRWIARLTFKDAFHYFEHMATGFDEGGETETAEKLLNWSQFFDELNMQIAMYNLRVLSQSMESFKRQKQLEML